MFKINYLFFLRFIFIFLSLAPFQLANAGLPFLSETVAWEEDVILHDGKDISVQRTVTYGPDQWGRSGRGGIKKQTITFYHHSKKIVWESTDIWPIHYLPIILDFVNDTPVVIMPIYRWGPCNKYGFPPEGLIAFHYQDKKWKAQNISNLPNILKTNLSRIVHDIKYSPEYKGRKIDQKIKENLQGNIWGPKLGTDIIQASQFYSNTEDSCKKIKPPPDPQNEQAVKNNSNIEKNAKTITATVIATLSEEQTITADDFKNNQGIWSGHGYLYDSCKNKIKQVEPLRQYDNRGGWALVGFQLILNNDIKIPIKQLPSKTPQALPLMQLITCDENVIYAFRRKDKETLLLHRFKYSGEPINVNYIYMPDTVKVNNGNDWGSLWNVEVTNNTLSFMLVNYTYTSTANLGGIAHKKQKYSVALPE